MTRGEAITEVARILGYRSDKATEILTELAIQQTDLETLPELPWFLKATELGLSTVVSQEYVEAPANFLKEWDEPSMFLQVTDSTSGLVYWSNPLVKDDENYLRSVMNQLPTEVTSRVGRPTSYAFNGTQFLFFPTPDAIYPIRLTCYKRDDGIGSLANDSATNKWLTHLPFLLIGRAGARIAGSVRDKGALDVFGAMVAEGMARITSKNASKESAGRRYVMGGED